jgi:hypothetical protein
MNPRNVVQGALALSFVLGACVEGAVETNLDLAASIEGQSSALQTENTNGIWRDASDIKVCFQPAEDVWDNHRAEYNQFKADARVWLERAYEGIPGVAIGFRGFGECPNFEDYREGDEGSDTIELNVKGTGGGAQASGKHVIRVGTSSAEAWVTHEMIHTLGFDHEHRRSDAPGSVGNWDEYTDDRMTCIDDVMWDVDRNRVPIQTTCHPSNERQDAEGVYLTKYDFWSISNATNYCHCRNVLSDLDRLGLEMTYPTDDTLYDLPVHFENGFRLGDGSVLGFANVTLHHDWFVRGGLPDAFFLGTARWQKEPFTSNAGYDSGDGFVVPSSGAYRTTWFSYLVREHFSQVVDVEVSPSKATALLMAVL